MQIGCNLNIMMNINSIYYDDYWALYCIRADLVLEAVYYKQCTTLLVMADL